MGGGGDYRGVRGGVGVEAAGLYRLVTSAALPPANQVRN